MLGLEVGHGHIGAAQVTDQVGLNDLLMGLQWCLLDREIDGRALRSLRCNVRLISCLSLDQSCCNPL